ncbi:MAG: hypothetical protein ACLSUW_01660 [Akkermansia sp.]
MAFSATANAELKVATVDVQKLFADYYKTHEAQAEVDKAAQAVQQDNNTRAESIKKMEADFTEMVKKLQDPSLNEKDKRSWSKSPDQASGSHCAGTGTPRICGTPA